MTSIGSLIASFEGDTTNFDAAVRRVETRMKALQASVSSGLHSVKQQFSGLSVGPSFEATAKKIDATIKSNGNAYKNLALNANASQQQITESATRGMKDIGAGGFTLKQELSAVAALQRQRSSETIRNLKAQERAALNAAAGVKPFRDVMQSLSTSIATMQGPLGGVSGRLSSMGSLMGGLTASTGGLVLVLGATVAAAAGAAVGIFKLATASQELGGQIFDLSTKINFSAETLSSLKVAAELSGGSLESFGTAFGIFDRNLDEAKDKSTDISKLFKALNIDITNNEVALRQAFKALSVMKDGSQQTALAMKLFGRSGKEVLGVIKEADGDIDGFTEKMREMGLVITSDGARKADKFGDSLTLLQGQLAAVARQIGTELVPIVSKAAADISKWLKGNQGELQKTGQAVASLTEGILDLIKGLWTLTDIPPIIKEIHIVQDITQKGLTANVAGAQGTNLFGADLGQGRAAPPMPTGLPILAPFQKRQPDHFKFTTAADLVERAQQKALDALKVKEKKGGGGGGGSKGESAIERAAKQAFDLAKIQLQGAESVYRDAIDKEQAYYDQSLTSLETYTQKRIELEDARYEAEKETFEKEQRLISTGSFKPGERDVKQAELNQNMEEAEREHFSTVRGIRSQAEREQLDADKRHNDSVISLHEAGLKGLEARLARSVSVRRKSAVEAEEEMFSAMQQVLAEKGGQLQEELNRVLKNPTLIDSTQAREVQDQINALNLEIQQSVKEHFHKLDDARQEDIQSAINYNQQLRSIASDIISIELDTARIRVQAIKDNSLYRTQAIQEEARIEKRAEQERTTSQVQELKERKKLIRAEADVLKSDPFEALKQMKAVDQQIAAIERNAAARQVEIQRQAQEQILEKWREVATDITDILSAGITGGFKGALDEVKSLLDQISREILSSAILKILQPNAPNQGSQAGGIIGGITNKILDAIGLGREKEKPLPPGITLSRGDEMRPRVFGEPETLAEKASTIGDRVTLSQTQATRELNRARTEQTHRLVTTLNGIAEHICQCQPAKESFTEGLLRSVIPAAISAIPVRPGLRPNVSSTVRDIPEAGGEIISGGGTGSGTRPRIVNQPVTPSTVIDASENVSTSIVNQTREEKDLSTIQAQDLKNTIQLTGQSIVQGLAPVQQGFWSGLVQAAVGGALSGLAGGLTSGMGGGEKSNNEGPIGPRPTTKPILRTFKRRAVGGPVSRSETYLVGEKGEELFTPGKDGYIVPHSEISNVQNIKNQIVNNQSNKTVSNQQKEYIKDFVGTVKNEMARVTEPQTNNTQTSISSVINNLIKSERKEPVEKAIQLLETRIPELRIMRTDLKETNVDKYFKESFKSIQSNIHYPKVEGRALGGPVSFGKTYVVGERGREVFTEHTKDKVFKETKDRKETLIRPRGVVRNQIGNITNQSSSVVTNGPRTENARNLIFEGPRTAPVIERPKTQNFNIQNLTQPTKEPGRVMRELVNTVNTRESRDSLIERIAPATATPFAIGPKSEAPPQSVIQQVVPELKVMLAPSLNKESSVEKILKESVKTDRFFPRAEGRALGGPVRVGLPYDVHKDERIIPTQPGQVFNQSQMNTSRGDVINKYYNIQLPPSPKGSYQSPKSKRELAESLLAALQSQS